MRNEVGMSFDIEIRPASISDVAAITEIYAHHVKHGTASFEIEAPDSTEMLDRFANIQRRGLPYLVAERNDQVIGYAYAAPYRARPAYKFTTEDSVYVHPAYLGQQVGTVLLESLIPACKNAGARQVIAVIGDSSNIASIRLHEKFTFRHVGVLKDVGFKFDRWLDSVLMQRSL